MKTHRSRTLEETTRLAEAFVRNIKPLKSQARIVGLHGELGAGKTAFVKGAAKALGVSGTVASPTFVIEKIYPLRNKKFRKLVHIDVYRLSEGNELQKLNWEEISSDPGNLILLEWPERVADILPRRFKKINFEFVDETTRKIRV